MAPEVSVIIGVVATIFGLVVGLPFWAALLAGAAVVLTF